MQVHIFIFLSCSDGSENVTGLDLSDFPALADRSRRDGGSNPTPLLNPLAGRAPYGTRPRMFVLLQGTVKLLHPVMKWKYLTLHHSGASASANDTKAPLGLLRSRNEWVARVVEHNQITRAVMFLLGHFPVGMVTKPSSEQSQDFSIHNEDFPALPGPNYQTKDPTSTNEDSKAVSYRFSSHFPILSWSAGHVSVVSSLILWSV